MRKIKLSAYLNKRAAAEPLTENLDQRCIRRAVVIPARDESTSLPATVRSLENNPEKDCRSTLVLVVVNGEAPGKQGKGDETSVDAEQIQLDNLRTLEWLAAKARNSPLQLTWLDHSSPGLEFSSGHGVGLARKLGADSVLGYLANNLDSGVSSAPDLNKFPILHLDADTLVEDNYLRTVSESVSSSGALGGVINFKHRLPSEPQSLRDAVEAYDLFLRYYALGLRFADSPYAFHTIGSAMCSTVEGYVRSGGIPARRKAGEDFYFLQQLRKAGKITLIDDTAVHPSGRIESKNIFGTGKGIQNMLNSADSGYPVYTPVIFRKLKKSLAIINDAIVRLPGEEIMRVIDEPVIRNFLAEKGFPGKVAKWQQNYRKAEDLQHAFNIWFDALATYRLIRRMSATAAYPRQPLREAWDELESCFRLSQAAGDSS